MRHMNEHDLADARQRFTLAAKPNRLALAIVVDNLAAWTDSHSDGWAYWAKPRQAAQRAMGHIASTTNAANNAQEREDITDAEMRAAVRPIRAFLTRAKANRDDVERILRAVDAPTEA